MAVGRWLHDNPHIHYTSINAAAAVYMTDGAYSDFTLNDWWRRLGGGGAVLY